MDACCERIFSERGEEGKGGGGGERGDFTGASLRIADTQGCHNLAEKKLEILYMFMRELNTSFSIYCTKSSKHVLVCLQFLSKYRMKYLNDFEAKKGKPAITSTPCGKPAFFGSDEYFRCQGEKEMEKERERGTFFTHTHPLFSLPPSAKERRRKGAEF